MIKLTEVLLDGQRNINLETPVYVPDTVVVKQWHEFASVTVPNAGFYVVKESPEEVVRKIMTHKVLMRRYDVGLDHGAAEDLAQTGEALWKLAGLKGADSK